MGNRSKPSLALEQRRRMINPLNSSHEAGGLSRWPIVLVVLAVAAIALAGCGGGSNTGGTDTAEATTTAGSEPTTGSAGTEVQDAKKAIAPYQGQPAPFPVEEKLSELPKAGSLIAYPEVATPIGTLQGEFLENAAKAMGLTVKRVKAGPAATTSQTGMETIVGLRPAGVVNPALSLELYGRQIEQLQADGAAISTVGVSGPENEKYGIEAALSSTAQNEKSGELLADYLVAEMSDEAKVVVYEVPQLPFTAELGGKFVSELEAKCPKCSVRTKDIALETIGTTAPSAVVSDLQANPETTVAMFTTDQIEGGLPAALKAAGIEIETLGYAPAPQNLQYLKEGKETAVLAYDLNLSVWSLLDMTAREIVGQKLTGPESEGYAVTQFLTKEDITFNPEYGWSAYPDFEKRFKEIWGVGS
ncbi:MAG: sugar ABC transporter substrate-binding protein [Solirubrobacterales bacterium]